jgi:aminopeptidase N
MSHYYYFDSEEKSNKSFELPGAKPQYNPDKPGKVEHIFLDLVFDIPHQSFQGICYLTLTPLRQGITELILDAVDLDIECVLINNISQPFDYDKEKLIINLLKPTENETLNIQINYQVINPNRGLYFISPNQNYPDKPIQIWTQGEDEDSRFWFPCFDYPGQLATSEIRVSIPAQFMAISNGELIETKEIEDRKIYHWLQKQVHPTYLMTLAIGDFAEICDQWAGIPVNYYVEKGRESEAVRSMGKTPKMMEFLSNKYGCKYPFPKYAQVCVDDFIFGGMENTSTTLLTDRCLLDEKAALDNYRTETLVLHELAHQWFGDLIVIKHWSHAWIKEGMASYAEVLWTEFEYNKDEAAYYLLGEARSYLHEDKSRYRRPIVTNVYREAIELYDRHLYEKGACVYHMIRTVLGDDLFAKSMQKFVINNSHKTVETVDLLRAIDEATGYNLAPLFDQYVFRGGHPDFKVSYNWDNDNKVAKLTVNQSQVKDNNEYLFDLKISVGFGYKSENTERELKTFILHLNQPQQSFYFPLDKKPDFVSFDVGNNFLKTVSLDYPLPQLKAQLKYDPDPISRIYAAINLAKKGGLDVVKSFAEALQNEQFWGVKVEIVKCLSKIKLNQVQQLLINSLTDENVKVKRAVIQALSEFKNLETYNILKKIALEGEATYNIEATAISSLGGLVYNNLTEKEEEIIAIYEDILAQKSGWNETIRSAAISGLSKLKNSVKALGIIIKYTKIGTPQPLRLAAIRALGAISTGQKSEQLDTILDTLENLATETFFLTQIAVITALKQMETPKVLQILEQFVSQTSDGRTRRMAEEAISKVQKSIGSDKAIDNLKKELDKLKKDNQDLQSRLASLEAKN